VNVEAVRAVYGMSKHGEPPDIISAMRSQTLFHPL